MLETQFIKVESWGDIQSQMHNLSNISFLIPEHILDYLGGPLIKAYQDGLSVFHHSLTVECESGEQVMICLYHGIEKILYQHPVPFSLLSLAEKKGAQIITHA